jgi:hypothetical protein
MMTFDASESMPHHLARRRAADLALLLTALLGAASCDGGPAEPPPLVPVARVTIEPDELTRHVGETTTLQARVFDAGGAALTGRSVGWSSSSDAIASVTATGVVTMHALGEATITATVESKSASAVVRVVPVPIVRIELVPGTLSLDVGQSATVAVTAIDSIGHTVDAGNVAWAVDDADVASVAAGTAGATVTGVWGGATTVRATSAGLAASVVVQVRPPLLSYLSFANQPDHGVRTIRADGTGDALLPGGGSDGVVGFYDWSPRGDRFAYTELIPFGQANTISVVTREGAVTRFQAAPSEEHLYLRFAWSPDGSRLLFLASVSFEDYQLFVVNPDGSGKTAVGPPGAYGEQSFTWSPDGRRIAFSAVLRGPPEAGGVWLADPDGSNLVRLTPQALGNIAFSPDGRLLAGTASEHVLVYSVPDGALQLTIPPPDGEMQRLRWSPDGRHIAGTMLRQSPLVWDLAVIKAEGGGLIRIEAGQGSPVNAEWSPDGRRIVFTKQAFGGGEAVAREVFVVKADGTGLTRVTTNVAEERFPRWVP